MYLPHPKGTAQICQPVAGGGRRQLGCVKEIALGREGVGGMGGGAWPPAWCCRQGGGCCTGLYLEIPGCDALCRAVGTWDELILPGVGIKDLQQSLWFGVRT